MREITSHVVEGDSANHQLKIEVLDEPGAGGANHWYMVTGYDAKTNPSADESINLTRSSILFQNGPIKESGVNGLTQEALLAIVIDRLQSFQRGPFKSKFNEDALYHAKMALNTLKSRTEERIARNVEGTHQK
jgi:hypothetical protein